MEIVNLHEASDIKRFGGKAASLARMLSYDLQVPPGFVISIGESKITQSAKDEILARFDALKSPFVAVRSSAVAEDGDKTSWAGQLETALNVKRNNLISSIENCLRSGVSERAKAYAQQNDTNTGEVAVIVQAMIQSDVSGVAFSIHPVTQNSNQVIIEAVEGLGEALVSGMVTPDTYISSKTGELLEYFINQQAKKLVIGESGGVQWKAIEITNQKLSSIQIKELILLVKQLDDFYGFPVDVEWALKNGEFFILQSRPITTLS